MHGVHHELQRGVNDGTGFFRVEPFNQRGGTFEIGKQRRDRFPLTLRHPSCFQGRLLSANAFSQMGWGITHRGVGLLSGRQTYKALPSVPCPNETAAFVIHYLWMGIEELFLKVL